MSTDSDIQKMTEALDLPDALAKLTNSDKAREQAAARNHPDVDAEDNDDQEDGPGTAAGRPAPLPR